MGDWGGDNDPNNDNQFLAESIEANQAEIQQKKQELYEKRFDIVKSQGAQKWLPSSVTLADKAKNMPAPSLTDKDKSTFDGISNVIQSNIKKITEGGK